MELIYGFTPYLRRLGMKPRRPHSFVITNPALINVNNAAQLDMTIGEGTDFLVDSIVVDTEWPNVNFDDCFLGFEALTAGYRCFNRNGAFLNASVVGDGPFSPFLANRSQPSPFVLPWILKSNERLRFHFLSPFGAVGVGEMRIVVNGYLLDTVGHESPFIPYIWTLSDQVDLPANALGQIDKCLISGVSDFFCTSISSKEDLAIGSDVIHYIRSENADEGGRDFMDRSNYGQGCFLRNINGNSESALPVPFNIRNNSVLTEINENPGGLVRRPQLCLFGFFVNPLVFPNADIERGVL